jgi:hypothetical protein
MHIFFINYTFYSASSITVFTINSSLSYLHKLSASSDEVGQPQRVTTGPLIAAMHQVGAADHGMMLARSNIATNNITLANLLRTAAGQLQNDSSHDSQALNSLRVPMNP